MTRAGAALAVLLASCSSAPAHLATNTRLPTEANSSSEATPKHLCPCHALAGTDGVQHDLTPHGHERFTVLVFHADDCPVMRAHAPRLAAWSQRYQTAGVRFYAIDSQASTNMASAQAAVRQHALPFPILLDPGARIANALDAQVASYAVVLDGQGNVRYAGGLDSDRDELTPTAQLYVEDALDDLIGGRPVRVSSGKALGCALRTR